VNWPHLPAVSQAVSISPGSNRIVRISCEISTEGWKTHPKEPDRAWRPEYKDLGIAWKGFSSYRTGLLLCGCRKATDAAWAGTPVLRHTSAMFRVRAIETACLSREGDACVSPPFRRDRMKSTCL
jgi:hypothetical protein